MKKTLVINLIVLTMFCLISTMTAAPATAAKISIVDRFVCPGSGLGKFPAFRIEIKNGDTWEKILNQLNDKTWTVRTETGIKKVKIPKGFITPEMIKNSYHRILGGTIDSLKEGMVIEYEVPQ